MMRDRTTSVKAPASPAAHPVEVVPPEGTNVLFDVWLVSRATHAVLDAALAPSGLTADEFGIYSALRSADSLTPSDLARWMSAPATTVSSTVKRLEKRGHVERTRSAEDGRSYRLRLTPAGHRAHQAAGAEFLPVLEQVEESLGRHQGPVRTALDRLRAALDAIGDAGDPTP